MIQLLSRWLRANEPQQRARLQKRVALLWQGALYYTIFVILFGAVVRITGSGAGCGQHWPSCHGEIAHLPRSVETLIEFTHRLTSGLSLLLVVALSFMTWAIFEPPHPARRFAFGALAFMIVEALVGAALVLLGLVGQNASIGRAVIMAVHLVSTSVLLFSMFGAMRASQHTDLRQLPLFRMNDAPVSGPWVIIGALGIIVVSAAGAVTALGDTLYPVAAGQSGLAVAKDALDSGAHFLEQLRGVHPILASLTAVYLVYFGAKFQSKFGKWVVWTTVIQVGAGLINIQLSAPGWMQVTHLAMANALWLFWLAAWIEQAILGAQND